MKNTFKTLALSLLAAGSAYSQMLLVDFNQQNTNTTVSGFTIVTLTSTGTTALGTSGSRSVSLNVTDIWSSLSNSLSGVNASNAPSWFNANTADSNTASVNQDKLTKSTPGLSAADLTGSFTLSGFLATDTVTVQLLGVRGTDQQDATATFTLGGVNSTSGASGFNYETSTETTTGTPPAVYNPLYGQPMVWTLTGSTSYVLNMTRTTGAPAISAMSVTVVPEPSSALLLFSAGAGLLCFRRRRA